MNILSKILAYKKEELAHYKRQQRFEELKAKIRDARSTCSLSEALRKPPADFAIIAEIKKQSPSKGLICSNFDPVKIAKEYVENGAAALSVLTDEHFFGGHLDYLRKIRSQVSLPLLRKDFLWEPYQIYAAREAGADAILLIAAMLEKNQAADLQGLAIELKLSVLFEVHHLQECEMASAIGASIVGINNRDLETFKVDLATSEKLVSKLPGTALKVSESGIDSRQVMERLKAQGIHAFLIGESLMKTEKPGEALKKLMKA